MEEYLNIINTRNSLPVNTETYVTHSKLAERLFYIYMDNNHYDDADKIIEETMLMLPPHFHPLFIVSEDKTAISFNKNLFGYSRNQKYLSEALTYCPGDVYLEVPFGFATQLICYKKGDIKPLFVTLDRGSEDDREWYEYYEIKKSYRKIKIHFN